MTLRERVQARLAAVDRTPREVDLVFTHTELSFAHGTGILMSRILAEAPPFVLFRSFDNWGGRNEIEPVADYVLHRFSEERAIIGAFVAARLRWYRPRHIVAVPYTREDVVMVLTAKAMTGAPLTIWIMDDNTLLNAGVPREEMRALVDAADARFAISAELCDAYEGAFGAPFRLLPPLVARSLLRAQPSAVPARAASARCKAVIVGNIWHQGWLDDLLPALAEAALDVDWFTSSADLHFLRIDPARLAAAAVTVHNGRSHGEIAEATAAAEIVLVPSTNLSETDGHAAAIGRWSLPSKLPFVTASAGTPFLVLANGESAAAGYVRRFGLGEAVPYESGVVRDAVARLRDPSVQKRIRSASQALAPLFDATGTYRLLTEGATRTLADDRFDALFDRSRAGATA